MVILQYINNVEVIKMNIDTIVQELREADKPRKSPEEKLMGWLKENRSIAKIKINSRTEGADSDQTIPRDTTRYFLSGTYCCGDISVQVRRVIDEFPDETYGGHYCRGEFVVESSFCINRGKETLYPKRNNKIAREVWEYMVKSEKEK